MRTRTIVLALAVLVLGAMGGAILAPPPANAVSREIIQIQQSIAQILQNQQDLRTDVDTRFASMQVLVQQSLTAQNQLSQTMGSLQKTVQDAVANSGANTSSTTQQIQGISDNMTDMQARVGKLAQQMSDIQSTLQQINAKVSGPPPAVQNPSGAPMGSNPGNDPGSSASQPPVTTSQPATTAPMPGISGDTLYTECAARLERRALRFVAAGIQRLSEKFPGWRLRVRTRSFISAKCFTRRDSTAGPSRRMTA